jgi:hypothetical protein
MPGMNGTTLGTAIATALGTAGDPHSLSAWQAIATAIVAHIASNAIVAGTATGAMSGGPGVPVVGTVS